MRCCGRVARIQKMACRGGNTCSSADCYPHYVSYQTHHSCSSTIGRTIGFGHSISYCRWCRPTLYPLISFGPHICSLCLLHRVGHLLSEDMAKNPLSTTCHNGRILTHISIATLSRRCPRWLNNRTLLGIHRILDF